MPAVCERILIVEDEALVALQIEDVLVGAGFDVVGISDTMAGTLALVARDKPHLALCDIRLGAESGVDIAAMLKERGVPSLFVSGNCATTEGTGVGLGCLHKPFDKIRLLSAIAVARALLAGKKPPPLPANMHLF